MRLYGTCLLSLLFSSTLLHAGNLYRFTDENGTVTLSKTLPAEYAQKGYHILDDRTMRVIERVPRALTEEEIAEHEAKAAAEAEQARLAELEAEKAEKARQEQRVKDKRLLLTYPTEADLKAAHENEINFRQEQIDFYESKLPQLQEKLEAVQKEAAERELSGGKLTDNMKKRLTAANQEIDLRHAAIAKYKAEIESLNQQYESDLKRLQALLNHQK